MFEPIFDAIIIDDILDNLLKVDKNKFFECDQFNLDNDIKNDKNHKNIKIFQCEICNKNYSNKNNLKNHLSIHTGNKPHKCNICQKSFRLKRTLTEHILIHTG